MEIKLPSALRSHKLRLAVKALACALLIAALKSGDLGFWPTTLFLVGTLVIYATPLFRTFELASTLIVFFADVVLTISAFNTNPYVWLSIPYFAASFYIVLGIKELAFVKRDAWQRMLALGLAYPMLLMFFYYSQASIAIRLLILFFGFMVLTRDVLPRRLPSWLTSLLSLEIAWSIALLPIGFVSQAGLATLSYFILMDISYYYYLEKKLNKRILLIHATLLAVLTLLVFAFSRWSL